VDAALREFGMAMGPLETGDLSGLDVGWRARQEARHLWPAEMRPFLADRLCELGRFGQKTGAGWYRYEAGSRAPLPDPEVERIAEERAREHGVARRAIAADEIVERTIYALVNEGARLLAEGIALRAGDVDVVYLSGYGFPAHRGGPMWHADTVGLARVRERLAQLEREHGAHWKPAPLLDELAAAGRTFADHDAQRAGA
jgi:3-hydroxyacyl-CoA dehydrogenase